MDYLSYINYFEFIVNNPAPAPPYDNPAYMEYTQLNRTRFNRWLKLGRIDEALAQEIQKISRKQTWIIITEPWCGDAAHITPFLQMIADLNPLIHTDYELRDAPPFRIESYLTNGKSRSIPILVVKDESGTDLFHWGPRPREAQELYLDLANRNAEFEEVKILLQKWYNRDKGRMLQDELLALFRKQAE